MNTILVPTDLSPVAENALQYAIDMAQKHNLHVMLYHVVQMSTPAVAHVVYIEDIDKLVAETKEKLEEKKSALQSQYPDVTFEYSVDTGLLIDSLKQKCDDINPIAIIMGITGSGTTLDKMIGSNAISAMNHLKTPVFIIPKNATFKSIEKVAMACDLKKVLNSTPIVAIRALTKLFASTLHVVNIDFNNKGFTPNTPNEINNLESMLADVPHQLHFIESENVQTAIDNFVENNNIDLLLMVPKKHSFFESLFHKSATKEMAYHSKIPMLALHQE